MPRVAIGPDPDEKDAKKVPKGMGGVKGEVEKASQQIEEEAKVLAIRPYQRKLGNWIRAYLEYTKESESPENYHLWVALSSIASAVRRNVFLDQGLYVLFPNLYVAFIGPPARTAKSTALYLGRQIISQVPGVIMGPEACSREQLIDEMAECKFDNQCAMTIHSSEMSDLIDTSGILMIQFLTSIYDGNYVPPSGWNYNTKHQGKAKIINPFLNLILGTTPSYFAESMPDNIVGHGFTSRTIIVAEDRERHTNSLPEPNDSELGRALIDDLKHISRIRGQFRWGGAMTDRKNRAGTRLTEAQVTYDDYYQGLYKNVPIDHRLEGFHWRKKTHVLKVAMVVALSQRDDLVIESTDIELAVQFLHDLEPMMARAFSAVGKFDHATTLERIGNQIRNLKMMSIEDLYARNYFSGDRRTLDSLVDMLESMGTIKKIWTDNDKGIRQCFLVPAGKALPWSVKGKKETE